MLKHLNFDKLRRAACIIKCHQGDTTGVYEGFSLKGVVAIDFWAQNTILWIPYMTKLIIINFQISNPQARDAVQLWARAESCPEAGFMGIFQNMF